MAFDFKKEYKELYRPKNRPEIVDVPSANYIGLSDRAIQMRQRERISRQLACYMLSPTL